MKINLKDLIYLNSTLNRFTENTEDSQSSQRRILIQNRK